MASLGNLISLFIIVGTLGSLVAFFLILHLNRTIGQQGESTGHSYDGIEELDNPLPYWWYWMFILSIIFGIGYLAVYPGLGNFKGVLNWSAVAELTTDQDLAEQRYAPIFAAYRDIPLDEVMEHDEALNIGRRLFANNCAVCHGATAQGSVGFPNLIDAEWIWGGDDGVIEATILSGRNAAMPPWGLALGERGVTEVTEFVRLISGQEHDPSLAEQGRMRFSTICAACHGADGSGNAALGAPNLTNNIWLYGGSRQSIADTVNNGRNGMMPSFRDKLGEDQVHILAAYVKHLRQ